MKSLIRTLLFILSAVFLITLCSCSVFTYDRSRFDGGETLDEELLSKIEQDLHSESQTSGSQASESQTSGLQASESQTNESHISESDTEKAAESGGTVYWTSGGTVWHTRRDCSYLKNSQNVLSGTIDEAISDGKKKLCSSCEKH